MRLLSTYHELKLYRNRRFLLDAPNSKQMRHGILITVISDDRDELIDIIKSRCFDLRYIKSFFTEKRLRIKALTGAVSTIQQHPSKIYKEVKEKLPKITFSFLKPSQYQNKNLIYDTSVRLSAVKNMRLPTKTYYVNQVNSTIDVIHSDERFSDYKKKYYIIPIDDRIKIDVKYLQRINVRYPQQAFFYRLFTDPSSLLPYIGSTFIVYGVTGMFTYFTITQELLHEASVLADEMAVNSVAMEAGDEVALEASAMTIRKSPLFRFMKGMWAFAARDVAGMKETTADIEPDEEVEALDKGDSDTEEKVDKIVNKLSKNKNVSKGEIADKIIGAITKKTKTPKTELLKDDSTGKEEISVNKAISDAIGSLKTISAMNIPVKNGVINTKKNPVKNRVILNVVKDDDDDESDEYFDDEIEKLNEIDQVLDNPEDIDEDFKELYTKAIRAVDREQTPSLTPAQQRRVKTLKERFGEITLDDGTKANKKAGRKFKDMVEDFERIQIEQKPIPVKDLDKSISCSTVQDITRQYNEKMLDATIVAIIKFFQESPEWKMMVISAKKEDISDAFNAMYRYSFVLEDEFGHRHTLAYNIPKLVANKFFYVSGSKKMLKSQLVNIPIIKTKPDEVRFQTAHNQMTIQRFGRAFSPKLEILKKFLRSIPNDGTYGITYRLGNSYEVNKHFDTMMEYDDLAKEIYILTIQSKDRKNEFTLCLNQANIRTKFEELDIAYVPVPGTLPVGFVRSAETGNISRVIEFDTDTGYSKDLKNKGTLSEVILGVIQDWAYVPDLDKRLSKITAPSRYMYSRMEYVNYKISVGSFLGILYGLTGLLRKMAEDGLKYEIYDARKKRTPDEANTQNFIRFKNKYLYYNVTPVRHALILNGIAKEVACENFDIEEMDTREPYLQACEEMFQTRHVEKAYDLCKQFMIDPVDKQVLNKLGLPTDFLEVMLYASSLLENNHVDDPKRIQNLRLRKLELIPIFMYKSMVRAYQDYRYMYTKNGKMTSKPNDVIKRMTESQLFNDYDVLNPIREMECEAEATFKGPGGCRVEDAYTLSRRAYDKSMVGICATSGPDGPGIGINKFLSMNPRVSNLLGFMNAGDESDTNDIGFGNIGSIAELSVPFPINHDDARRLSFVAKESKHLTAVADTDPPLIGNGVEKVMPYMCSSDFIVTAKHDGRVLKVDKELGVAIVEYEDGTVESIDITDRQQKDGGMGIYVVCKKEFEYKEGEKFKANSVLVKNPSFFSTHSGSSAPQFNSGTLAWVGVLMSPVTFEDSSVITERIAEKMVTEVIIKKSVVIGAKSRLIQMVNIGDYVKTGEPLITYQNELSDDEINTVVNGAGDDDDMSNLDSIINTRVKSKVTGFVHDVRIYYTVPERDQSETIAKTVNAYNKRLSARKNMIKKFNAKESDELIQDHIGVSLPGAGEKVNGEYCPLGNILIEIYVKYRDYPGAGDKITYYCSMKSVLCRTLPMKYAPYPVGKKEERPLDGVLSIISIEARQVSSIMYALYGGKCVWALKERIRDIYNKYAKKERDSKK